MKYPVFKISFESGVHRSVDELKETFEEILFEESSLHGIALNAPSIKGRFRELLLRISEKIGEQVVVLIDEYDKPILDNITNAPLAVELREELKSFYSVLKDADKYSADCDEIYLVGVEFAKTIFILLIRMGTSGER